MDSFRWADSTISVDGEQVGLADSSYNYGSGELSLSNWKKQNLTISGSGKHTVRLTASNPNVYSASEGTVLVKDNEFEKYAQQSTFGGWTDKAKNCNCWITGNLSALQKTYAKDTTPKGRVLHAIATLLTAGENTSFQSLFRGFGYAIDYMNMTYTGTRSYSSAPTGNEIVDTLVTVGEPLVKTALAVPSGYRKNGSVALQLDFTPVDATSSSRQSVTVTSSAGAWTTPPLLAAISGYESSDDIFLPGLLSLSASGAVYSKLTDLTDYYLSLAVSTGEAAPTLEQATTHSEDGEKWTEYNSVDALLELGNPVLTGGQNGKITVGKSAAPWLDPESGWNYSETKPDKEGNTQEITNPSGLTISFKPATGIFSGKFNLFFDWETEKWNAKTEESTTVYNHKAVSCAYEGVVVNDGESSPQGVGSAAYSGKYTYEYSIYNEGTETEKTYKKTYTKKFALPVEWTASRTDTE